MSDEKSAKLSRRAVLKSLAALSACPAMMACEFVDLRDVGEFVDETPFSLTDPGLEALSTVGETACFEHGIEEIVLVRASEDEIVAYSRLCPHANLDMGDCGGNTQPAQWDAEQQAIVCGWHGSTFNRDGELISPPNTDASFDEPIQVFPVEFDPETGEGTVFRP